MYTILLVDDEQSVLEGLCVGIDWAQLGISNVLTATDGLQALELIKSTHIDLLITDILMPKMDGLTLLSSAKELRPDLHCILLSAHGEFEYARNALLLGVENYLLKPVVQEELEATIEKALDNIYTNHNSDYDLFKSNILSRWTKNAISSDELCDRASLLGINIYLNGYCVICIRKRSNRFSLSAYIEKILGKLDKTYSSYSFWDEQGRFILIIGKNNLSQKDVANIFSYMCSCDPKNTDFIVSVGPVVQSSENVSQSYQFSLELLETANFASLTSPVLVYSKSQTFTDNLLVKDLHLIFQITETPQREQRYHEFIVKLIQTDNNKECSVSKLTHSLIQLFNQEFPQKAGIQKQLYNHLYAFTDMPASQDPSAIIYDLLEYSYLLYRYYFDDLSPIVQQAISYIHKSYANSPSIKEFCVKNRMNTTYLGYLFKKETGIFFNNYLTRYKLYCSLSLLMETDIHINTIAQMTGFSSPSYFITCFKKQFGLSPIKYRITSTNT